MHTAVLALLEQLQMQRRQQDVKVTGKAAGEEEEVWEEEEGGDEAAAKGSICGSEASS